MSVCTSDENCVFQFHCGPQGKCQHDTVFPLSWYTIIIYLLIPFACGLVNTTGHSMGVFKVLIVMNMLRYQSTYATMVTQALVVGSALPNYFSILSRKHPTLPTSLVNFNVVYILVPCCLLGSTLGSLIGLFIPIIGQDILIMIVFSYFSFKFFKKFQSVKAQQKEFKISLLNGKNQNQLIQKEEIPITDGQSTSRKQDLNQSGLTQNLCPQKDVNNNQLPVNQICQIVPIQILISSQKLKIMEYEKSYHFKDIIFSILVFLVFQFLVFLVQGKLPFFQFSHCNWKYGVGLGVLVIVTLCYLKFIHNYLKKKFQMYERLQIQQQIQLNKTKNFGLICFGGFSAGIIQGVLGVGSGSAILATLLITPIHTLSATATSGYQILFIGSASLVQGFINGEVNIIDSVFFICLCGILGGIVTLVIAYFIKRSKDKLRISKILVFLIFFLCFMSIIMVIPSGIQVYFSFGWKDMTETRFKC